MKKLICFGEAIIDLLSNKLADGSNDDGNNDTETFTKFAGGAPANVAVAAAKLGADAYFCGMLGEDSFGHFLHQELQKHKVHTDYVKFTRQAKTALAFVSLDEENERSFEFYRDPGADMLFTADDFEPNWFEQDGLFHICSNSLTAPNIYAATLAGIKLAKDAGWTISFDVNLRLNLWSDLSSCHQRTAALIAYADIIKMSQEELDFLRQGQNEHEYLQSLLASGVALILVSDGAKPLKWYSQVNQGKVTPPRVAMRDATAAGDAFVGGLLYQLATADTNLLNLIAEPQKLAGLLQFACCCGAYAASKKGAFPSLPTVDNANSLQENDNEHA